MKIISPTITEPIFHLLFLMYLWKVSLLPSQQFEMQVKVKWHHKSHTGNLILSCHETKELIQITTEHSQLMFGVRCLERNNQGEAGTLRYTEDCGASQIKTIDSSGTFIYNSNISSLQHFSDNSKYRYKSTVTLSRRCAL